MTPCQDCSLKFPLLEPSQHYCAKCDKLAAVSSDTERKAIEKRRKKDRICLTAALTSPITFYSVRSATRLREHRLNKRPQNANLKKANEIVKKTESLKKLAKSESINIKLTLAVSNEMDQRERKTTSSADYCAGISGNPMTADVIKELLKYTEQVFDEYSAPDKPEAKVDFAWLPANKATDISYLDIRDDTNLLVSSDKPHSRLAADGLLSDKDVKGRTLTLQLRLYEEKLLSDSEDDMFVAPAHNMQSSLRVSKRKLSSMSRDQSPGSKHYHSFTRETCVIRIADGVTTCQTLKSDQEEIILVPQGWCCFVNTGKREGGFLGYGFVKFAFKCRIGSMEYAVLQMKNLPGLTEKNNECDLHNKLKVLAWEKYFLDSIIKRAVNFGVKDWPNAFLGTLVTPLSATEMEQSGEGLIWSTFLVVPLLACPQGEGSVEFKFSRNTETGNSRGLLGMWVDAYAHHTIIDSAREWLIADLQ
ncbi:hypothetical protein K439DRAFT_1625501, partial [Ramaria rubella]